MAVEIIHSCVSSNSSNNVKYAFAIQKYDSSSGIYTHFIVKDGVVIPSAGDLTTPSVEETNFYTVLS